MVEVSSQMDSDRWSLLLRERRPVYLTMVCLAVALHASNGLIVAATLPSEVAQIGGLAFSSWAVTVYMVASVMSAAAGGRLKGALGNRAAYGAAAALFAVGTLVCAAAPTMGVLLGGRLLQGFAGSAIMSLSHTLVRSLFPERLWPKVYAWAPGCGASQR
jgi:MFS family permease